MELLLIEGGRLLEHRRRIACSSLVPLEVSEALAERQLRDNWIKRSRSPP
jgi:hypothetical protein